MQLGQAMMITGPSVATMPTALALQKPLHRFNRISNQSGSTRRNHNREITTAASGRESINFTSCPEADVAPGGTDTVGIDFSVHYVAHYGECLKLVGSLPETGEWDLAAAPEMNWDNGNVWRAAIEVPLGAELEYKLVHVTPGYCRWEEADNHHFTATPQGSALPSPAYRLAVQTTWNNWNPDFVDVVVESTLQATAMPYTLDESPASIATEISVDTIVENGDSLLAVKQGGLDLSAEMKDSLSPPPPPPPLPVSNVVTAPPQLQQSKVIELDIEGTLALDPVEAAPAVVSIPAAAVQVEIKGTEESVAAAPPLKRKKAVTKAKALTSAEKLASSPEETATAAISIPAAAVLAEASDAEEASLAVALKKSKKSFIKAKTLTTAEVLAQCPGEATAAAVSVPAAALQVEASLIEVASVVAASKEIEVPISEAKHLALEGQLAVYPVGITSAVVTIPAAAVQVAASEAEESSVAAATRKIKETISEAKDLIQEKQLALSPEEAAPAVLSIPAAAAEVAASEADASVAAAPQEIEEPMIEAKDLAPEEQLALDPVDSAPVIMSIPEPAALSAPAAAAQVESSNAEESIAVVVPKKKSFIKMGRSATLAAMGMAAAGLAVGVLGDAALMDVAVSGAMLVGAASFLPGSASSKVLKSKGAAAPAIAALAAGMNIMESFNKSVSKSKGGKVEKQAGRIPVEGETTQLPVVAEAAEEPAEV